MHIFWWCLGGTNAMDKRQEQIGNEEGRKLDLSLTRLLVYRIGLEKLG